jgi:hypothetical protein
MEISKPDDVSVMQNGLTIDPGAIDKNTIERPAVQNGKIRILPIDLGMESRKRIRVNDQVILFRAPNEIGIFRDLDFPRLLLIRY